MTVDLGTFGWEYVAPLGLALVAIIAAIASRLIGRGKSGETASSSNALFLLAALSLAWAGILASVAKAERWVWLLSWTPSIIVTTHAIFLYLVRRTSIPTGKEGDGVTKKRPNLASALPHLNAGVQRYFSLPAILLRFLVPALLVGALPIVLFRTLVGVDGKSPLTAIAVPPEAILGAKMAFAGAFVFVLFSLGRRAILSDITAGSVTWSAVTLCVGPIVGGVLALVLSDQPGTTHSFVTREGAFFVAGFSPKFVVEFLDAAVRKVFGAERPATTSPRVIPLGLVRGINRAIEDRLAEEGIEDAHGLAMASPFKLLRNTPFDRRQILAWIDSALLVTTLPDSWQALERLGITGAIDLAWSTSDRNFTKLADAAKIDMDVLMSVAERLSEDSQVQLVWLMYQLHAEDELEGPKSASEPPPSRPTSDQAS